MNEPQTASELMLQNQLTSSMPKAQPGVVLPNAEVQKFLFDVLNQTNFPGSMVEFVADVKRQIAGASIAGGFNG